MYQINLDITNNILCIEVSGSLNREEVIAYLNDIMEITNKFGAKELSMIVYSQRLDPLPQECVPIFSKITEIAVTHMKKVAVVHSRTVTQMQMKRLETEVCRMLDTEPRIFRFKTKKQAWDYLMDG